MSALIEYSTFPRGIFWWKKLVSRFKAKLVMKLKCPVFFLTHSDSVVLLAWFFNQTLLLQSVLFHLLMVIVTKHCCVIETEATLKLQARSVSASKTKQKQKFSWSVLWWTDLSSCQGVWVDWRDCRVYLLLCAMTSTIRVSTSHFSLLQTIRLPLCMRLLITHIGCCWISLLFLTDSLCVIGLRADCTNHT